jgi:predicted acetyltransferase
MHKREINDYKELLKDCFATDSDLINTWHIEAGTDLDTCVNRTYNDLQKHNVMVFVLEEYNKIIGYFGIEDATDYNMGYFMTGFFIKPEYRTKKMIKKFWDIIDNTFTGVYSVGVFKKNIPAIEFLKRKTDLIIEVPEVNGLYFVIINKKEI